MQKKLVVIGGGAAGFFCAVNAARLNPALQVTIVERTSKVLQKVKVSGGGRCNVTHSCFDISDMSSRYPRGEKFVRKAFHHFFTTDTIQWFESRGVPLKTEADGRMFPMANESQAVIDCMLKEVSETGVKLIYDSPVKQIDYTGGKFQIHFSNNTILEADYVSLACGGFQKMSQFEWLANLGLDISEPVPSLFTFNFPKHPLNQLMGLSVPVAQVKIAGTKFVSKGAILLTHWGLSGPAVLRLSAFAARELAARNYHFDVLINWCPDSNEQDFVQKIHSLRLQAANQKPSNGNFTGLPARLWIFLLQQAGINDSKRWADLSSLMINRLSKSVFLYEITASGKTTFKDEFVTAGGIALHSIDVNTMMSKKHDGLYFAGEIMDVDGITGGYNFQHAWTSGFIAAKAIAAR